MMNDVLIFEIEIEEELRRRQRETDHERWVKDTTEREARQEIIQKGVASFWTYCQMNSPLYYTDEKTYLKKLCDTLQAFYEKRIIKFDLYDEWEIVESTEGLTDYILCIKIMINIPPRHGKSRTLINLSQWVFGKNQNERIIECSYNDDTAGDFAKFTRDGIQEEKVNNSGYVFSDFFPGIKIKHGSNSYYKWALEGQFFNYLGAGIGGSITGKGGSILIIDDPIKLAEEAFNEDRLQKIWDWYTGTFLSRGDAYGGEPLEIIVMTRWSNNDLCGRIIDTDEKYEWFVCKLEAYNEDKDEMLCENVLSKKRYLELRKKMVPEIFRANYHQETINQKGRLYKSFKTYDDLPRDEKGEPLFEGIFNYTDTADEGSDFLASGNYMVYNGEAYITDIYYTKDGMEITEPKTAEMLQTDQLWKFENDGKRKMIPGSCVNVARVESNNGGRGFARNLIRILKDVFKTNKVIVHWFHQSKNKRARILSNSSFVMEHIYLPVNWRDKWPEFYGAMTTYLKEGKSQHDDAPDMMTGIAESLSNKIRTLE